MSAKHSALVHQPFYYRDPDVSEWVKCGREELIHYCQQKGIELWYKQARFENEKTQIPVVSLDQFNNEIFKESKQLGIEYQFNTNFLDIAVPSNCMVINCAGSDALSIAQAHQLAPSLFQLNFQQLHYVDSLYQDEDHQFSILHNQQIPMLEPHWIHSPAENLVKYGPFLKLGPLRTYLGSPLQSATALIILIKKFGLERIIRQVLARKRSAQNHLTPYAKRPHRHLIFCFESLELLSRPRILYSKNQRSWHVLNYHSPGFTMGFAFARDLVKRLG